MPRSTGARWVSRFVCSRFWQRSSQELSFIGDAVLGFLWAVLWTYLAAFFLYMVLSQKVTTRQSPKIEKSLKDMSRNLKSFRGYWRTAEQIAFFFTLLYFVFLLISSGAPCHRLVALCLLLLALSFWRYSQLRWRCTCFLYEYAIAFDGLGTSKSESK